MWNVSALVLVRAVAVEAEAEAEVERGANSATMSIITSTMSTTRLFVHVQHGETDDLNDCRGGMTMSSVFRSLVGSVGCWLLAVGCWIDLAWFFRTELVVMEWLVAAWFAFSQDREARGPREQQHRMPFFEAWCHVTFTM